MTQLKWNVNATHWGKVGKSLGRPLSTRCSWACRWHTPTPALLSRKQWGNMQKWLKPTGLKATWLTWGLSQRRPHRVVLTITLKIPRSAFMTEAGGGHIKMGRMKNHPYLYMRFSICKTQQNWMKLALLREFNKWENKTHRNKFKGWMSLCVYLIPLPNPLKMIKQI